MNPKIIQGLSFPLRVDPRGRMATSKLDDTDVGKIQESIVQILLTSRGERRMEPEFGSDTRAILYQENDPSLDNIAAEFARSALEIWEPRISVDNIVIIRKTAKIYLKIDYHIRATQRFMTFITPEIGGW